MFGRHPSSNALEIPKAASANPLAIEVLRVWAAQGEPQQIALRPNWSDAGAWGLLLVDVARHAAEAYSREGHDRTAVLSRIKALFDAEWSEPTDTPLTEKSQ